MNSPVIVWKQISPNVLEGDVQGGIHIAPRFTAATIKLGDQSLWVLVDAGGPKFVSLRCDSVDDCFRKAHQCL